MAGEITVDLFQDSFDGDFVITLRGLLLNPLHDWTL